MGNETVGVHLCIIRRVNMHNKIIRCKKWNITHGKLLELVSVFAIGAVPIHDVAAREKRLLGSELAFVHFYLILDHVPKYSITQSFHLYNPFELDAEISRN